MKRIESYALHQIHHPEVFGFDPDAYSRFKFGDENVARQFGEELADGFIRAHLQEEAAAEQLVVISSPYSFIPTATFSMKTYFVHRLNRWLADRGRMVIQEAKVHRTITYKEDYGALSAAERMRLIGNDSFHIDAQFLADKTLLFLDDIRITGSHERMILKMAAEYGLQNKVYLLYFAELSNPEIHPRIENHLNYHQVKTIFDLGPIINGGAFSFNTRLVKYILNCEFSRFSIFINNQSAEFVNMLYNLAIGNGYHTIDAYQLNLKYIKNQINTNTYNLI